MMRWIKIGCDDTEFLIDEQVDKFQFQEENERIKKPASYFGPPPLLGSPRHRCHGVLHSARRSRKRRAF
jgi:hypothetical protein